MVVKCVPMFHGVGVFATTTIAAGTRVTTYEGQRVSPTEARRREELRKAVS